MTALPHGQGHPGAPWSQPKQGPGRRRPPGSAGVPPACTAVACRSVSLDGAPATPPTGTAWARTRQRRGRRGPPGSAGVPPACTAVACRSVSWDGAPGHPAGENRMGPSEAEPWRLCRSSRVEEMGEAVPGCVRAGRPRSRVGFIFPVEWLDAACPAVPGSNGYARRTGRGKRLPSRP